MYDDALVENTQKIETTFLSYIEREHAEMLATLEKGRELTDEVVEKLNVAIASFKESHAELFAREVTA